MYQHQVKAKLILNMGINQEFHNRCIQDNCLAQEQLGCIIELRSKHAL